MSNLEMELKIKEMDEEELEFKIPVFDDEADMEFDVADDEDFFIAAAPKKASKSLKSDSAGKSTKKPKKSKKKASEEHTEAKKEAQKSETKTEKEVFEEKTEKKEKNLKREDTESPVIKIIPFETEEEKRMHSEVGNSREEFSYIPTEEFIEEASEQPEETFNEESRSVYEGEIEREKNKEEEPPLSHAGFKEPYMGDLKQFKKMFGMLKQLGSLAAMFILFVFCFKTYGYYIDKKAAPITTKDVYEVAENISEKTSDYLKEYEEDAKTKKEEYQKNAKETLPVEPIKRESNEVKIERLLAKEPVTEEPKARFGSLSELTKYINENTLLLNDILNNAEKKFNEGNMNSEEYKRILNEAKEKLTELSTLLTSNYNVYTEEAQTNDYDILYENINTVNEIY